MWQSTSTLGVSYKFHGEQFISKKYHYGALTFRIYENIPHPRFLTFKSRMVNDYNQHLCLGWHHPEVDKLGPLEGQSADRLFRGLKPMATMNFEAKAEVRKKIMEAQKMNFMASTHPGYDGKFGLTLSVQGKLKDHFDLEKLAADYDKFMGPEHGNIIQRYANQNMGIFHDGRFNVPDNAPHAIGLAFGYPVENSFSLLGGVRS